MQIPRFSRVGMVTVAAALALAACGNDSDAAEKDTATTAKAAAGAPAAPAVCPAVDGSSPRTLKFAAAPPMCIDPAKTYTAVVTTSKGDVTITFDAVAAPKAVNNFVVLSRYHYYDGVAFHRIIPGFVVQGGDPNGNPAGTGDPGYTFADELPKSAYELGALAMANRGPNTNGSQFFIVTGNAGATLDRNYTKFGKVTAGMDVVMAIEKTGTASGTPSEKTTITKVVITEK
ncbi:MAG: peptidylprolyl isomerase [Acidimicrobiia bacterium]